MAGKIAKRCGRTTERNPDALGFPCCHAAEERTFRQWDRVSLGDLRRAIERGHRVLTGRGEET